MEEADLFSLKTFWSKLQEARQKILLLDYDGTLAPFHKERDKAYPYAGVTDILKKIQEAGKTRLIIVSGRNIEDIISLLGLEKLPEIWGGHGFERLLPGSILQRKKLSDSCSHKLQEALLWAKDSGYESYCEQKASSLAFHWRGRKEETQKKLEDIVRNSWEPLIKGTELAILPFDGGLELRCGGMHKGEAIRQVLDESSQGAAIAYLGDDLTDEDAFRALKGKGLTVLVRKTRRSTLADCWLTPPDQLLDFLQNWYRYSTGK